MNSIIPRLPEPFFCNTSTEGGWLPPKIFAIKTPILMILVLEDRYESPLSIDTKKVPVALHLTSQWRFNDVRVAKNSILRILNENRPNFKFLKILGICDFGGAFG